MTISPMLRVLSRRGVTIAVVTLLGSLLPLVPANASSLPTAFHTTTLPGGLSSVNVCSYAVSVGTAHCNAQIRTDSSAKNSIPQPGRVQGLKAAIGNNGAYSPAYLQAAYNVASASAEFNGGVGQIVGIVDAYDAPNLAADLAYYRNYFGLTPCATGTVSPVNSGCVFEKVGQTGSTTALPAANSGWALETSLDVEMVSAICPNCQILVVEATSASFADLGTAVNEAVALGATVVSNSYGGGESSGETTYDSSYYNHPGVAIVAASGDSGYGVEYPAASPNVVAVGGTSLTQTGTTIRDGSETVWSGAGAGCSAFEPKPTWQHDAGCSRRTVADVSAVADPATGVWVYDTYGTSAALSIIGGTSVASPIIGALFALAGRPSGNAPYPAADLYNATSSLVPVTAGTDGTCSATAAYLCDASKSLPGGYNGPAGLGTPGASPDSMAAFSTPAAPTTPPNSVSVVPFDGAATLSWTMPSTNNGSKVTGYNVYQGTSSGGESGTAVIGCANIAVTTCTISSLTNATTYYFKLSALNSVGESAFSTEVSVTPGSAVATSAPILTTVSPANNAVTLTWSPPLNLGNAPVTGYNVYQGTSSGGESGPPVTGCANIAVTTCTISSLTNATTYFFKVSALNASTIESPLSNELFVAPSATASAPSAPTLASITSKNGVAVLTWTHGTNTGGGTITGYNVYRGTSAGGESSSALNGTTPISSTTYTTGGLTNGTSYYFTVKEINSAATSVASNELSTNSITIPAAPTVASPTPAASSVQLSWTASATTGGSPILGYNVYIGTSAGGEGATPSNGSALIGTTSYTASSLSSNTTYYFRVRTVNAAGPSPWSTEVSAKTPGVPAAPTLSSATAGNTSVTLAWTAPSVNGGLTISGYNVYMGTTSGGESPTPLNGGTPLSSSTLTYTATSLTNGTAYFFKVAAVNLAGQSPLSSEKSATPGAVPGSPVITTATAGNTSVQLTWTVPIAGGTATSGYYIYRGTSAGGESATALNSSAVTTTTYSATGLTNGTTYYFVVKAKNSIGLSLASNEVSALPATVPGSPTLKSAVAGNTQVTLTWTAPTNIGGSLITGYNVFMGTTSGGQSATPLNGLTPLSSTTLTYTATALTNSTTYYFTVKALNVVGSSPASAQLSAKPANVPGAPNSPTATTATSGSGVRLTWTTPTSNGGSSVTSYVVYRSTTSGNEVSFVTVTCSSNTCNYSNSTSTVSGTTYYYKIAAVNSIGTGPQSTEVSAKAR